MKVPTIAQRALKVLRKMPEYLDGRGESGDYVVIVRSKDLFGPDIFIYRKKKKELEEIGQICGDRCLGEPLDIEKHDVQEALKLLGPIGLEDAIGKAMRQLRSNLAQQVESAKKDLRKLEKAYELLDKSL